ncbi:hypothetical protein [Nannocystis punicea]|uniref:Uncharacterized protein n=1 Tax=Nannocystis punicea TaxID=2995304 RepID=A0ABY7H8F3_9BACT|nr:hypothetical protein [Nannocystis poenicansa]WAS95372.1 hypothetical protein O0S08_04365 [Nannocystis poenicansa]
MNRSGCTVDDDSRVGSRRGHESVGDAARVEVRVIALVARRPQARLAGPFFDDVVPVKSMMGTIRTMPESGPESAIACRETGSLEAGVGVACT